MNDRNYLTPLIVAALAFAALIIILHLTGAA